MPYGESQVHLCLLEKEKAYFFCLPARLIKHGTSLLRRFSDISEVLAEDGRLVQMVKMFDQVSSAQTK